MTRDGRHDMRLGRYVPTTLGEDGVIRDVSKGEHLPDGVFAVNAWVELVKPAERV